MINVVYNVQSFDWTERPELMFKIITIGNKFKHNFLRELTKQTKYSALVQLKTTN